MKVVFHPRYKEVYAPDPAAKAGRIESILKEIEGIYELLKPEPAKEEDLRKAHSQEHIDSIKRKPSLYEVACLSAGGAILAAELAIKGEPSFGLIRPPGHHANPNHCWGFCFFNNIAIAIKKLITEKRIKRALIVDFDLHFGDGTFNIFKNTNEATYFHLPTGDKTQQLKSLEKFLEEEKNYEILAVSAGFDRGKEDWGGVFEVEDYKIIGQMIKKASQRNCQGKRFALLEGGYNHNVLGKNVKAFLAGFE
ncbi:MAG: histone deacetylase [Candidatus Bathyarchaeota archaeon]|nr:histone deacetylase [Candidatus Bathyarchaeota archaeon]